MNRNNYDTVTEAMIELKKLGYTIDFSILTDRECLISPLIPSVLSPDDFEIDDFFRFEGNSDPGDGMIVYAISSKHDDIKGIVVNAYGMYSVNSSSAIVKKLVAHPKHKIFDSIENEESETDDQVDFEVNSSPEGSCPICWGRQEYDGKIRVLIKDKQIDVNNHMDKYMSIQKFMKRNIDGITMQEAIMIDCPNCSTENKKKN
jgi:hypothetical protein